MIFMLILLLIVPVVFAAEHLLQMFCDWSDRKFFQPKGKK